MTSDIRIHTYRCCRKIPELITRARLPNSSSRYRIPAKSNRLKHCNYHFSHEVKPSEGSVAARTRLPRLHGIHSTWSDCQDRGLGQPKRGPTPLSDDGITYERRR